MAATTAAAALFTVLPATAVAAPVAATPAVTAAPAAAVTAPVAPVARVTPAAPVAIPAVAAPAAAAPTAAATSAVSHALGKIGSPYRYGAAGPSAFDCSGLVTWAFRNAGVVLPRTSRAMSTIGTPVAKADLRPGDLVFFYRPVSHVGIYVGDGKIVHASNRKSPVKVADLNRMPFTTARRV